MKGELTADGVLLLVGASLVLLGLSSRIVKRFALSPVLLALAAGVVVGPNVLGLLDPTPIVPRGPLLEQLARVALAFSVVDITLRTNPEDLRKNAGRLAVLLLIVMPGMWLMTALGAHLLLGLPIALALLLGAALTPTDPGVASALVTGVLPNRLLPRRVRMSLQVEAGANDGLALPIVLFAGLLASSHPGGLLSTWIVDVAKHLGIAVAVGIVVGYALRKLTDIAGVDRLAEEDWFPLASAGLAVSTLALAHLLGGTGIFAAFVAGLVFSEGVPENLREPIHTVHRSLTKVVLSVLFLAFGLVLPIDRWWPLLGLAGIGFALWTFVLRRAPVALPAVGLLTSTGWVSSSYIGASGPLGVASIYYLVYAERYGIEDYERFFAAGTLAITVSVLGYALTSAAAAQAYARKTSESADEGDELVLQGPLP